MTVHCSGRDHLLPLTLVEDCQWDYQTDGGQMIIHPSHEAWLFQAGHAVYNRGGRTWTCHPRPHTRHPYNCCNLLYSCNNMQIWWGGEWLVADVAFECITQFTVEGNWDLSVSLFISKRCCNSSRIRVTSFARDTRPEVTVRFLAGMKSYQHSYQWQSEFSGPCTKR